MKPAKIVSNLTKTSLITALVTLSGSSSVSALPSLTEAYNLLNQPLSGQILAQNRNSRPREVIINTEPGTVNPGDRSNSTTRTRTTTTTTTTNRGNRDFNTRFTCDFVNGEYTVMYHPETQGSRSFPWAIPSALGGGWTPERRCNEITARLEAYRLDGLLEMSTGIENGYDTVCVTTQIDPTDCRIVLTVPPGQDPQITRDLVFENLLVADDGGATQGVYTFGDNGSADILNDIGNVLGVSRPTRSPDKIDLRPFLDPADGGTGTQLKSRQNKRPSSGRKPSIFNLF